MCEGAVVLGVCTSRKQEVFGNPATCAHKFASVTGIKPGNLFPSASFKGKSCGRLLLYALQETVPGVLGYQADLLAHLNPDPSAWPLPAALVCQAPFPREHQSLCSAPLHLLWVFSVAESRTVLHSSVHLNRAFLANIFC